MRQEIQTYLEKAASLESNLMNLRISYEALKFHDECYQEIGTNPDYSLSWVSNDSLVGALSEPPLDYYQPSVHSVYDLVNECREDELRDSYPNYYAVQQEDLLDVFSDIVYSDGNIRHDIFFKHYKAPNLKKTFDASKVVQKPEEVPQAERFSFGKCLLWAALASLLVSFFLITLTEMPYTSGLIMFPIFLVSFTSTLFKGCNKAADAYDAYLVKLKEYNNFKSSEEEYFSSVKSTLEEAFQQASAKATPEYEAFAQKRIQIISSEIKKLESIINESEEILNKLYEKDILYPKYRNFAAVCTILEYFETSRCSSLTGADGAYNLFESETRQNLVILKLDEILENLDELKTAMYKCCTVLEKASKQLDDVLQELQQINEIATQQLSFQALTMSYASAAAKNTEAIKYLTLIS
ncbi:MAG: hypothetical protein IJO67_08085 [Clostridia bacterium]|nr:hypothetical protein [Clostridia bacterium]